MTKLIAFDLDGTIIANDSAQDWLTYLADNNVVRAQEAIDLCQKHIKDYYDARLDMISYMNDWLLPIKNQKIEVVEQWVEDYVTTRVLPNVYQQAKTELAKFTNPDSVVVLISASPLFIVSKIAQKLGITHSIGVRVQYEQGRYTNLPISPFSYQRGKVMCLHSWMLEQFNEIVTLDYAYSDSVNDISLLAMARHAICVNPDKKLLQVAETLNWNKVVWCL